MQYQNLLHRPTDDAFATLELALAAIKKAFPIPAKHCNDLPYAVRDLSRLLTQERGGITQSYWSAPRFLSAYLRFFLPWNLYRLSWFLPQQAWNLKAGDKIVDLGSGPLTLPLAIWCFCPELRAVPLHFSCFDVAAKPMELGLQILKNLAGESFCWQVHLHRKPLDRAIATLEGDVQLVIAGNVLNELSTVRQGSLEERLDSLIKGVQHKLAHSGKLLVVEPGNRLGGKLVALTRKVALEGGFAPLAPCTHKDICPALEHEYSPENPNPYSGWCHFIYPATNIPAELQNLGEKAKLEKETLAISCLLLQKEAGYSPNLKSNMEADDLDDLEAIYQEMLAEDAGLKKVTSQEKSKSNASNTKQEKEKTLFWVRIISDLIRLPDEPEPARYACGERGLFLVKNAVRLPSGGAVLVNAETSENGKTIEFVRDKKSGAIMASRSTGRK